MKCLQNDIFPLSSHSSFSLRLGCGRFGLVGAVYTSPLAGGESPESYEPCCRSFVEGAVWVVGG